MIASLLFIACPDTLEVSGDDEAARASMGSWNFQASATNLVNYSTGNTNNKDITYSNDLKLLGTQRTFRWMPDQASPGGSATKGCIQTEGATASGKYFLSVSSIKGPFKTTVMFTDTGSSNSGRTVDFYIGGSKKKSSDGTSGTTLKTSTYEYTGTDTVTLQLGCTGGGVRLFDLKIETISSSSSSSSSSSTTTTTTTNSTATTIFNNLKGKKPTTGGWADRGSLTYANASAVTYIEGTSNSTKRAKFTDAIKSDTAAFIVLSGDIDLSDGKISDSSKTYFDQFNSDGTRKNGDIVFSVGSNTTIIGINNARIMFGGLRINGKSNVIIRNVTFYDAHGSTEKDTKKDSSSKASADNLSIEGGAKDIWIDSCRFTDGKCSDLIRNYNHDGSLDVKKGTNITISWNHFTNHDKVMLFGNSDSEKTVSDRSITLHHNYFQGVTQRNPRTRAGQFHLYSNYYNNIGVNGNTGYCLGPGVSAQFLVENNFFGTLYSSSTKVVDYYDTSSNPAIVWSSNNNKTVARSSNDKGTSKPWSPAYSYSMTSNSSVASKVGASSGAGPNLGTSISQNVR